MKKVTLIIDFFLNEEEYKEFSKIEPEIENGNLQKELTRCARQDGFSPKKVTINYSARDVKKK